MFLCKLIMSKTGVLFAFVLVVSFAPPVVASDSSKAMSAGPDMVETFKCIACHRVDDSQGRKRLGPDFNVIAQRYAGDGGDTVVDYLAARIRNGGRGSWGAVPMPAQSHVNENEAQALAQWILSLMTVEPLAEK
jgi:cytochrome c